MLTDQIFNTVAVNDVESTAFFHDIKIGLKILFFRQYITNMLDIIAVYIKLLIIFAQGWNNKIGKRSKFFRLIEAFLIYIDDKVSYKRANYLLFVIFFVCIVHRSPFLNMYNQPY